MGAGGQIAAQPGSPGSVSGPRSRAGRSPPPSLTSSLEGERTSFPLPHDQNEQMATAFMIADALDELQAAVRAETGAPRKARGPYLA